mmetsp:Transcript_16986/g.48791  ORF Transcript_16986/g.48791 Transcript_16986/m.48791 type:complete len:212 (-) Transcript_16986:1606-2241(-)
MRHDSHASLVNVNAPRQPLSACRCKCDRSSSQNTVRRNRACRMWIAVLSSLSGRIFATDTCSSVRFLFHVFFMLGKDNAPPAARAAACLIGLASLLANLAMKSSESRSRITRRSVFPSVEPKTSASASPTECSFAFWLFFLLLSGLISVRSGSSVNSRLSPSSASFSWSNSISRAHCILLSSVSKVERNASMPSSVIGDSALRIAHGRAVA